MPTLFGGQEMFLDGYIDSQRDKAEAIAVVQQIPAIFRQALKTIAVRESDGLYDCCAKVAEGSNTWDEFARELNNHAHEHDRHVFEESYLQRLWTLQECLLSYEIQFVVCTPGKLFSTTCLCIS
jgi:hypothetical protein